MICEMFQYCFNIVRHFRGSRPWLPQWISAELFTLRLPAFGRPLGAMRVTVVTWKQAGCEALGTYPMVTTRFKFMLFFPQRLKALGSQPTL